MKRFVQFIAGAICPDCKSKDTIALNPTNDEIYCVKCNFVEKRPELKDSKRKEEIKVINIEDFKKNKDKNK
tara:strand:+ start:189 stop:401 length:213 start_codon:yes stop_codon:yes gene_type:complete